MHRYAVIITHNRRELLRETVAAIGPQVSRVIVIDNNTDPPVRMAELMIEGRTWTTQLVYDSDPVNLARLWQRGLSIARSQTLAGISNHGHRLVPVAFLCDDAPPPPGWFAAVTEAMLDTGAVAGASSPDPFGWDGPPIVKHGPDQEVTRRMPGWAFVLNAVAPLNFDQRFQWWWNDTDMDWQSRQAGGMVLVGRPAVPNVHPNGWTAAKGELGARVGLDRLAFAEKWGGCPW